MDYIRLNDKKIRVDDFLNTTHQAANLKFISQFIDDWFKLTEEYSFKTSGSTGEPKSIRLSRNQLDYSAASTLSELGLHKSHGEALLVIPADRIGGTMLIVRSLLSNIDLHIAEPTADFTFLDRKYVLTSITPYQLDSLVRNHPKKLRLFENILVGGGPLDSELEQKCIELSNANCNIYHTYGMTETASHVALRKLGSKEFKAIGDANFSMDNRSCLRITGTITKKRALTTNDIVQLIDSKSFIWKGRADFVINTGGIKISPEAVEEKLGPQLGTFNFFVAGVPDDKLGEKVVLIIEANQHEAIPAIDLSVIGKYARPKTIYLLPAFAFTDSGKIDRSKTMDSLHLKNVKLIPKQNKKQR